MRNTFGPLRCFVEIEQKDRMMMVDLESEPPWKAKQAKKAPMIFIPLIDIHQTHDQGFCLILFVTHVEQPDVEIILFSQKGELHISPKRKNKASSDAGIHPTYAHSTKNHIESPTGRQKWPAGLGDTKRTIMIVHLFGEINHHHHWI